MVPFYLLGSLLGDEMNLVQMLLSLCVAAWAVVMGHQRHKREFVWVSMLGAGVLEFCKGALQGGWVQGALSGVVCVAFCWVCRRVALLMRASGRVGANQATCVGVVLCVVGLGVASVPYGFPIFAFVACLFVLVGGYVGQGVGFVVAVCLANGAAIKNLDGQVIALYSVLGLCVGLFGEKRLYAAAACVVGYVAFESLFEGWTSVDLFVIIAFVCAAIVYCALPKSGLDKIKTRFVYSKQSARQIAYNGKKVLAGKLMDSGRIFEHMKNLMVDLAVSARERDVFGSAACCVEESVCLVCRDRDLCLPCNVRRQQIERLIRDTMGKEDVSILDYPQLLFDKCTQTQNLTSAVYGVRQGIALRQHTQKADEFARLCVAKQMGGVAGILRQMGKDVGCVCEGDDKMEERIAAALGAQGLDVVDVLLQKEAGGKQTSICLTLASGAEKTEEMEATVSTLLNTRVQIKHMDKTNRDLVVVDMVTRPKFDVVFATQTLAKQEVSGDTHAFVKLTPTKFLVSLCDGMGSGRAAEQISNTAISLVESFYKAGFDSEIVLDSVNKFLELCGSETFVALDIAVVDLANGQTDIIKSGSPSGYIKSGTKTEIVSGGALPLGIVEEVRPLVLSRVLGHGDMLLFCSDGVVDVLGDEQLGTLVNGINSANPQAVCNGVMDACLQVLGQPNDDMSVIAVRLFAV